jgi:hypothetical protein
MSVRTLVWLEAVGLDGYGKISLEENSMTFMMTNLLIVPTETLVVCDRKPYINTGLSFRPSACLIF